MTLYVEGTDEKEEKEAGMGMLPELIPNEIVKLEKIEPKQSFTEPPARYTEASLVKTLEEKGIVQLPIIPEGCVHNAHMFYLKTKNLETRQAYIKFMKENDILCVFHYVPLHSAPAGLKFGRFDGVDENTTSDSDRLVRLPMYYNINESDLKRVIDKTLDFFGGNL